jgi:hypothetical protein
LNRPWAARSEYICEPSTIVSDKFFGTVRWGLTKAVLMSRVWPGVVALEEHIKFQVSALRKALGANRELILAGFGRGYRFTGLLRADRSGR